MTNEEKNRMFELKQQIAPLQSELWTLEGKQKEEAAQSLLGKHFKYYNSYGSDERWWKYAKVLSVKDGYPHAFTFEHTSRDAIEIESHVGGYYASGGWEEISEAEFNAAWLALQNDIVKAANAAKLPRG